MRWANKSKDALPPFDKMKWLLTVAWVALHNQLIREVLEAWSLVAFGHVFLNVESGKVYITDSFLIIFVIFSNLNYFNCDVGFIFSVFIVSSIKVTYISV